MAEFDPVPYLGAGTVAPSGPASNRDTDLGKFAAYGKSMEGAPLERIAQFPASVFSLTLPIRSEVAVAATVESLPFTAPFPMKILAADMGVETLADGTTTIDLLVDGVSVLDAASAVTVGAVVRVSPEDGSEDVEEGSTIQISAAKAAGAAAGAGYSAVLWCVRR